MITTCTYKEWSELHHHNPHLLQILFTVTALMLLIIFVIVGNSLVIAAVVMKKQLRTATGMLILSLAVADLLVGLVILPVSAINEVLEGYWIFGELCCIIWLTMDIWMCTASIFNLVAISIDRYIAIIKPLHYRTIVTRGRARITVAVVWISSFLVCSPSFLVANTRKPESKRCQCTPAHANTEYIIFSASSSFYIPMVLVVLIYIRIYIAARRATSNLVFLDIPAKQKHQFLRTNGESQQGSAGISSDGVLIHEKRSSSGILAFLARSSKFKYRFSYEKRLHTEIKAAKTVAIVTGCFIICWLGFSILYGFSLDVNPVIWSIVFWLGYVNSALNPIIYTLFNRDFRQCFKDLLLCLPNFRFPNKKSSRS